MAVMPQNQDILSFLNGNYSQPNILSNQIPGGQGLYGGNGQIATQQPNIGTTPPAMPQGMMQSPPATPAPMPQMPMQSPAMPPALSPTPAATNNRVF